MLCCEIHRETHGPIASEIEIHGYKDTGAERVTQKEIRPTVMETLRHRHAQSHKEALGQPRFCG